MTTISLEFFQLGWMKKEQKITLLLNCRYCENTTAMVELKIIHKVSIVCNDHWIMCLKATEVF